MSCRRSLPPCALSLLRRTPRGPGGFRCDQPIHHPCVRPSIRRFRSEGIEKPEDEDDDEGDEDDLLSSEGERRSSDHRGV